MSTINDTCNMFVTQLKADKKKAVMLGVMLLAMVGVYARWLLKAKPADADAAPPAAIVQNNPAPTETTNTHTAIASALASVGEAIDAGSLSRTMARDLFDTDLSIFAPVPDPDAEKVQVSASQPSTASRWMKKLARIFEQQARLAEANRLEVEADLAKLQLQGTILGPSPKASVNGRIVKEGDIIGGFSVVEIGPRHVTLQKSGCNYRLSML